MNCESGETSPTHYPLLTHGYGASYQAELVIPRMSLALHLMKLLERHNSIASGSLWTCEDNNEATL